MLTPVRAASNASLSSHGQTAAIVASGLGRSVVAPTPVQAIEATDLNSAIAGRLNILLATARERMFDALLDAINAASRALPLPRREEESNLAFASRLAETIQKLPAARIHEIETQLANEGHTLPLRLIAEALKNPAGPEAARVVAYLETIRYKDRDLVARAVVRSYRQNDASPLRTEQRPEILLQEESLPPAVSKYQATVAVAPKQPGTPSKAADAISALSFTEIEQPVGIEGVLEEPAVSMNDLAKDSRQIDETEKPLQPKELEASTAVAEVQATPLESKAPVKSDPVIPKAWNGILASMTGEVSELIVAIIGEQETAILLDDVAAEPEAIAAILEEATTEEMPASPFEDETVSGQKTQQESVARSSAVADVTVAARQPKDIAAQPQLLPPDLAEAAQKAGLVKPADGLPYTQVPYHFAKDSDEGKDGEMHRRDYEGSGSHDRHAQSDEQHHDAETEGDADAQGVVPQDLTDSDEPVANAVADPAYALYQRMAGWE